MAIQLFIGLISEGTTDIRFLHNVIEKVFVAVAYDCRVDISIEGVYPLEIEKQGKGFVGLMLEAAKKAGEQGHTVLCIHIDADASNIEHVEKYKLEPFLRELATKGSGFCTYIVPIIPVYMTEAWMLANTELLKEQIRASKQSVQELGIAGKPESYKDPKLQIEEAIKLTQTGKRKRIKASVSISDLYETIGSQIRLEDLRNLPSFCHFEGNVRRVMREMGYLA